MSGSFFFFFCKKGKKRLRVKMTGLLGHEVTVGQLTFSELSVKKSAIYRMSFPEIAHRVDN